MIEPEQVPIGGESLSSLNENDNYNLLSPIYGDYYSNFDQEFQIGCMYYDETSLINSLKRLDNQLTIASLNIQSYRSKQNEITTLISNFLNNNINIALYTFQEMWVYESDNMDFFNVNGFKWYTKLRKNKIGGGVGTLVRADFNVKEILGNLTFKENVIESLCLKCQTKTSKFISLNIYRPPNQTSEQLEQFFEILSTILDKVTDLEIPFYLTGDLNLDLFKVDNINSSARNLMEILTFNGILNTITRATRITRETKSLIDIIGVGKGIGDLNLSAVLTTHISDHLLVLNSFRLNNNNNSTDNIEHQEFFDKRQLSEENLNRLNDTLSTIDWSFVINCQDTNTAYNLFIDKFLQTFNSCCPVVKMKKNKRTIPLQPWMSSHLLRCRLRRDELSKLRYVDRTGESEEVFREYRNHYNRNVRAAKREYYRKSIREAGKDSKKMWSTMKTALGLNKKMESCTHLTIDGVKIEDKKRIADTFNDYLTKLGPKLTPEIPNTNKNFISYLPPPIQNNLYITPLYPFKTINIIRSIKPKKSRDNNGLSMFIISYCAERISHPLTHIYNLSISSGTFPERMKVSKVSILHKSGPTDEPDNFRGISLIDNMSKPLEKHFSNSLVDFLNDNEFFSKYQYGFRRGYSTIHNLLNLSNLIIDAISRNTSCMSIFLDVRKCFDMIDREKLFQKLHYCGVRGVTLSWIKSYYQNRKQRVHFAGTFSDMLDILLGVLQGSVLGPILFLIFINDITNISEEFIISLFADDAFAFISRENLTDLIRSAQEIVSKILEWYHSNSLLVHPRKTNVVIFQSPRVRLTDEEQQLKDNFEVYIDMNNFGENLQEKITKLELVTARNGGSVKHLGMLLDETLSFKYHITSIYNKNSKIIYSMRLMRHILDKRHLRLLYSSYIKSYIDYSSILLCGIPESLLKPILTQQKKAIRIIEGLGQREHTAEYFKINLILPFPLLIKFNCSIFMHKYKFGLQPNVFDNVWPQLADQHRYLTRNRTNFAYITGITRNFILNAPLHNLPTIYNNLPNELKLIEDQKEFKRKCFTHFLNQIEF